MRLAEELGVSRSTVHELRKELQRNARKLQPDAPLMDEQVETDEMFQNAGGKKVSETWTPKIHQDDAPTRGVGTAPTTTTARR